MDPYMAYETPGSQTAQRGSKGHAQRSSKRSIFSCLICISRPAVDDDIHAGNTHKWMQSPDAAGARGHESWVPQQLQIHELNRRARGCIAPGVHTRF